MPELVIESVPDGAEVHLDGVPYGTTPVTVNIIIPVDTPVDMAIFVSPQYKDDTDILAAMQMYIDAVKADIGWDLAIVYVNQSDNRYDTIQNKIGEIYDNDPLKACMMIGEDMAEEKNVFHTSNSRKCQQALPFWQSYGASFSLTCGSKVVIAQNLVRVVISLMYPNRNDSYDIKKNQIISALQKFSNNRRKVYATDTVSFYDMYFEEFGSILTDEVGAIGNAVVVGNPTQSEVDAILSSEYKFVFSGGHGLPGVVVVNPRVAQFVAGVHGKQIKTPFLMVYGCGTSGWYTNIDDDCLYQPPSNRADWFGHTIFDNESIRAVIGGFPIGKHGLEFICSECLRKMSTGETIAEAMRGMNTYGSNSTLFGDPTFHY